MKIAGLQKTTLIDYPEKIAAIIFSFGCNFRCPYCHNKELVESKSKVKLIPEKEIFKFLKKRSGILDAVVITGGEPTLYKDLPDLIRKIKKLGYLVKLDTNGTNPKMIKSLLDDKLADYIAMDIKGPIDKYKRITHHAGDLQNILDSVEIIKNSKIDYEFRTTVVPDLLDKKDFEKIGHWLKGAKKYYLQQFRNTSTLIKSYEKIKPYSVDQLLEFAGIVSKYVKKIDIRGI